MISVTLTEQDNFEAWKTIARSLLSRHILPETVDWIASDARQSLFGASSKRLEDMPVLESVESLKVSAKFLAIAERVICHRDPERFARLYRILWRLIGDKVLLSRTSDTDIIWMTDCDKAVRRDRHKMHAFVRFRKVGEGRYRREQFAAWFEPTHFITRLATPFFMRRFPNMDWIIVTPDCTAIWDGETLKFAPGGKKSDVPANDCVEAQWTVYFQSIFNPARLKVGAMMSEMPKKYWHNMPEAAQIPQMIQSARHREKTMTQSQPLKPHPLAATLRARHMEEVADRHDLQSLEEAKLAIQSCRLCPHACDASQAVFGEGNSNADLMIVGEQPGDAEDIAGRPFVGPSGVVLNAALLDAGIDRQSVYTTNAVKHFKFFPRGKRRIHERPSAQDIEHCRWWLNFELTQVNPKLVIALGAVAARAITGRVLNVSDHAGDIIELNAGRKLIITHHPASILRERGADQRRGLNQRLTHHLRLGQTIREELAKP